ncbi:APC family permease [Streptomyces sp. NPDC057257]|uniref:APC family permease n=1 Tax=Streptomyces sp. NPDC057257 TaxID=3346071 RepID=UPI0036320C5C
MTETVKAETETGSGPRLHGNLGTLELFFSIMAYNAPLVVVIGVLPLMVSEGNGIGTPLVFITAGLILAAFSDGFVRMSKVLPRPGAFYSFITAGLGREVGLGAGFVMLGAYFCVAIGTIAFGGIVLGSLVTDTLHGPSEPWYVWAGVFWVVAAVMGYLRIDLSAKLTTILLFLELVVIAIYDFGVVGHGGGPSGLSAAPFSPHHLFDGSFSIGLLLASGMFGGFEVAVLFRDELRKPERSIPRATFGVILCAGVVYSVTAWAFINAVGIDKIMAAVTGDPTGTLDSSIQHFGGQFTYDAATVLVNTSAFAVLLTAHNVTARYAFNLSADGILPRRLSGVHANHGSPHVASITTTVVSGAVFIPVLITGTQPLAFYGATLGVAAIGALVVFFLSNAAVFRFMRKSGQSENFLHRILLPAVAAVGLGGSLYLGIVNFSILTGGSETLSNTLLVLIAAVFIGGVGMAAGYRRRRPDVYQRIGRQ